MNYKDLNRDEFNFKEGVIAGDECVLIVPKALDVNWTDENKRFRSCIIRKSDDKILNQSFSKFVNWGERPEFQPWDESWKFEARHKLDGSLAIVSAHNGEWIFRTRRTFDARNLDNGHEVDLLMKKYSSFFNDKDHLDFTQAVGITWLFEWVTPNNIIVLRESDEPELILLGAVLNEDASYYSQEYVDIVAKQFGFKRPIKYEYDSLADCIKDVDAWKDKEGVVLYSPCGQILKKIKASHYLNLHRLASSVGSLGNLIGVYLQSGRTAKTEDFYEYIKTTLDFEIAEKCRADCAKICDAHAAIQLKQQKCRDLIANIKGLSRKEQALDICQHYSDWRRPYCFSLIDKREMDDRMLAKVIEEYAEQ